MITLSQQETADVLDVEGVVYPNDLASRIMDQGYVLVAVSGPALERYRDSRPSYPPPADPEQIARLDSWCNPARTT